MKGASWTINKHIFLILICILSLITAGCLSDHAEISNEENEILSSEQNIETCSSSAEITNYATNDTICNTTESIPEDTAENEANNESEKKLMSVAEYDETIKIAAFNVQVFGVSKASKDEVMQTLAQIVRNYDVIAIQEIRDKSQTALPSLVELVNSDGSEYEYVVSERLGRSSSKEQYAYIYNNNTVQITGNSHTYPEPEGTDPFHRQPYIASISTKKGNFDATLIVIHTDPDEATEEINALDDVLNYSRGLYPKENDFIIIGDLNADGTYFDEDSMSDLNEYQWIIDNSLDTTTRSTDYTYDRIILTDDSDYTGNSGVFRFDTEYGLSEKETIAVSDHYPIYVELYSDMDIDI
jgi:endonuclease/exonuclease/phosphatase family metal-dependent hydrolase